MLSTPPGCLEALNAAIEACAPRTLLALGPGAAQPCADYAAAHAECVLTALEQGDWLGDVGRLGRFDLAFVRGVVEQLPKREAVTLLGQLRDQHMPRLYVLVPMGEGWAGHAGVWEQNDLIALGMELAGVCTESERPLHLYRFDIHSYKTTPEWFNSKYWAHPELWDK
jgi:hypothetical protein